MNGSKGPADHTHGQGVKRILQNVEIECHLGAFWAYIPPEARELGQSLYEQITDVTRRSGQGPWAIIIRKWEYYPI